MGYTHFFTQRREFTIIEWVTITDKVKKLFATAPVGLLADGGGEAGTYPSITKDEIRFNGVDGDSHETFMVTREHSPDFNFCKTARKPYDAYVCGVLCIINSVAPGALDISSDGDKSEWLESMQAFSNEFTKVLPARIRG